LSRPRIERIFGSGGGLVTVLDRVDAAAYRLAERLPTEVPVAFKGVQWLGGGSPLVEVYSYFDAAPADLVRALIEDADGFVISLEG